MKREDARLLLDRIGVLRHRSDLDLLVFFARHPRSLLPSESLAAFLGYDLKDIADSLETLLSAGLLKRTQSPAHAARMYVFALDGEDGGWLPSLLRMAATRHGRLALREELAHRSSEGAGSAQAHLGTKTGTRRGWRRLALAPKPRTDSGAKAG